jgi:hypothetical protein
MIPTRRERTCPRAVKRARHNNYRIKKPAEQAGRHDKPAAIRIHAMTPAQQINLGYVALRQGPSRFQHRTNSGEQETPTALM